MPVPASATLMPSLKGLFTVVHAPPAAQLSESLDTVSLVRSVCLSPLKTRSLEAAHQDSSLSMQRLGAAPLCESTNSPMGRNTAQVIDHMQENPCVACRAVGNDDVEADSCVKGYMKIIRGECPCKLRQVRTCLECEDACRFIPRRVRVTVTVPLVERCQKIRP